MKNLALIIILTIVVTACNNKQQDKKIASGHRDTLLKDSALIKTNSIFNNPFRDIDNFAPKVGYSFVDSLHISLSKAPQTVVSIKRDICAGDNCTSFKSLTNASTTLYLFKSDQGEYGFSNGQFVLTGDSLTVARNFYVGIETWPTDTSETVWSCTETVFYFYDEYVKVLERKVFPEDLYGFDFTLKNVPYEIKTLYGTNLYKDKYDELNELLSSKDEYE